MSAIAYGAGRCQPVSSEESGGKTVMPTRVGGGWLNQAFDVFSSAPTIRNKTKNTTSMANSVRCALSCPVPNIAHCPIPGTKGAERDYASGAGRQQRFDLPAFWANVCFREVGIAV